MLTSLAFGASTAPGCVCPENDASRVLTRTALRHASTEVATPRYLDRCAESCQKYGVSGAGSTLFRPQHAIVV